MVIRPTFEQALECMSAIGDVMRDGFTKRTCPICGRKLIVSVTGNSGDVKCETADCIKKLTLRGL